LYTRHFPLIYFRIFCRSARFWLILILFLIACTTGRAQQVLVRGIVTDSLTGSALSGASVRLFSMPKKELLGSKITGKGNDSGTEENVFTFEKVGKGNYMIVVSYLGYAPDSVRFAVKAKDSVAVNLDIRMQLLVSSLLQVVVQARIPPAIVKNDTIAFNAVAYPSPPNSTVEDLLRKLPGVEIDKDGHVTMQGQKVNKIMINGKDFFLNDLWVASQNLPADLVASVEVFDTQSERAKITGIKENGKGKTINLNLKKKVPAGYFGKLYGGYGGTLNPSVGNAGSVGNVDATNGLGTYSMGGNVTRLDGSGMVYLSGNANNINNQFTGSEHQNGGGAGLQTLNNMQINYRNEWTKNLTATINGARNYRNTLVNSAISRQTALGDSSILQDSYTTTQNKAVNYEAYGIFNYKPDSATQINLSSTFSNSQTKGQTIDTVSTLTQKTSGNNHISSLGKTDNSLNGPENSFSNTIDFSHAFKRKGRLLFINIGQNYSNKDQTAGLYSLLQNFYSAGNSSDVLVNQQYLQKITNSTFSGTASYVEPLGSRHLLDFSYTIHHTTGHSDKESFDYDSLSDIYDIPDSLTTNRFANHSTVQTLAAGYNKTEGKYQFQIGLSGQLTMLDNLNLVTNQDMHHNTANLNPRVSLHWEINKGKNMQLSYLNYTTIPTTDQLQPVPDLTNPYLIKVGNPDLKEQLTHYTSLRYAEFNSKTSRNWQAVFTGDYAQNAITTASMVLAGGVQVVEFVNVRSVYHTNGYLTYGFPLGGQKNGNGSLSMHGSFAHDISLVDGLENIATNMGVGGTVSANFHVKDYLFIDVKADFNLTFSHYSLAGSPPGQTLNENYICNINYQLPGAVTFASYYNLQVVGSQATLPAHSVSFWNASITKTIMKTHCELRLSAYDLLNSANSFTQTTGVNYTQTQKTSLPERIFLFSVIYRLRKT
jgi:hypothetical protein